jgi:peptidyl-tRNA hydrolase
LENYVLGKFKPEEHALRQSLIQSAGEAVQSCQTHGIPVAMNLHNGRSGDSSTEKAL